MKSINNYAFYFFLLLLLVSLTAKLSAQPCRDRIILTTQAEVDVFNSTGVFDGTIVVERPSGMPSNIKNLDAFTGLTSITGGLILIGLDSLTDISGLSNITSVAANCPFSRLNIDFCRALSDLSPLNGLTGVTGELRLGTLPLVDEISFIQRISQINSVEIQKLNSLTNLDGLIGVMPSEYLRIVNNDGLLNIDGLSGLTGDLGAMGIDISDNPQLDDLDGLANITALADLVLWDGNFIDYSGLSSLESISDGLQIENNSAIQNLDFLNPVLTLGSFVNILNNPLLSDCAAQAVCNYIDGDGNNKGSKPPRT